MKKRFLFITMLAVGLIAVHSQAMEQKEENSLAGPIVGLYGTLLGGSFAHEIGHRSAAKMLYNCNGFIWVYPWLNGFCVSYHGPSLSFLKKLSYAVANAKGVEMDIPFKRVGISGLKGVTISAAGPLAGLMYSLSVLILNTFYESYQQESSLVKAIEKTREESYLNNKQNSGIIVGCMASAFSDIADLLSLKKGRDGYKIATYLNLNIPQVHRARLLLVAVSAGAAIQHLLAEVSEKSKNKPKI